MGFSSILSIFVMALSVGYYVMWLGAAYPQRGFVLRSDR
jgi:hypothetical protein